MLILLAVLLRTTSIGDAATCCNLSVVPPRNESLAQWRLPIIQSAINLTRKAVLRRGHGTTLTGGTANKTATVPVAGKRGAHYPTYSSVPPTSFTCHGRSPGYYADEESGCQAFHVCQPSGGRGRGRGAASKQSFLCPNGTVFDRRSAVCQWWTKVECPVGHQLDLTAAQTISQQVYLPIDRQRKHPPRGNATRWMVADKQHVKQSLVENRLSNFTNNKMARHSLNDRNRNRNSTIIRDGGHNSTAVFSNMRNSIGIIDDDRLSMIDKLINSGTTKVANRQIETAATTVANGSAEIKLPVSNDDSNTNSLVTDMRNLNTEFTKYRPPVNRSVMYTQPLLPVPYNQSGDSKKEDVASKGGAARWYGVYFLSNPAGELGEQKTVGDVKPILLSDAFNQYFQQTENNNYKEYAKVKQITVMPVLPKVSDMLTLRHLREETPANAQSQFASSNSNSSDFSGRTADRHEHVTNTSHYHNGNERFHQKFIHLKELDKSKVMINGGERAGQVVKEKQVEITQRPPVSGKAKTTAVHALTPIGRPTAWTTRGGRGGSSPILGSAALYGIDMLASTSVINSTASRPPQHSSRRPAGQPAFTLFDIHTINHLGDGSVKPRKLDGGVALENSSRKPVANTNTFPPRHLNLNRKHDTVVVLPSLGFSLNSEDDIRAFNQAISDGLLDETR